MNKSSNKQILSLIQQGKTYNEISAILGCAKSTVAYHSKVSGVKSKNLAQTISEELKIQLNEFYKTHTLLETEVRFNVSRPTILKYCANKRCVLTEEERRKRNYPHVKKHRAEKKQWAVEYKGGKCELCGYSKNNCALDFHHKDPKKKKFSISSTRFFISKKELKKELDKCLLVCSNCHRELHNNIGG